MYIGPWQELGLSKLLLQQQIHINQLQNQPSQPTHATLLSTQSLHNNNNNNHNRLCYSNNGLTATLPNIYHSTRSLHSNISSRSTRPSIPCSTTTNHQKKHKHYTKQQHIQHIDRMKQLYQSNHTTAPHPLQFQSTSNRPSTPLLPSINAHTVQLPALVTIHHQQHNQSCDNIPKQSKSLHMQQPKRLLSPLLSIESDENIDELLQWTNTLDTEFNDHTILVDNG